MENIIDDDVPQEETIEEKAEQVKGSVKFRLEKLTAKEPFNRHLHNVTIKNPDFINRSVCVGYELYLNMLKSNGTLQGKTDLIHACNKHNNGMNDFEKVMFALCCYDVMCAANMDFEMKGKMNGELGRASQNPKTVQESILDNEDLPC